MEVGERRIWSSHRQRLGPHNTEGSLHTKIEDRPFWKYSFNPNRSFGFAMDDERLKQGGNRYFRELLQRIRDKPFVGMTNFKGNYVTKDDVKIAKNYLSEIELQRLNLLVSGFLDFAEFQALEMNPMTMKDWIGALDYQIIAHKRKVLIDNGNISHKQAIEKAEKEFAIYRKREMELLESDFDKEIKELKNNDLK